MMKELFRSSIVLALILTLGGCSYFTNTRGLEEGQLAPELTGISVYGKALKLSDLKGNIVLIDFWASWCAPCRKESPVLVQIYNKYAGLDYKNGQGFTILSVSLDTKAENWKQAIEKDGLKWPGHISDLGGMESRLAEAYSITRIPTKILINPEGEIVGVDVGFDEVVGYLDEHVNAEF